MSDQTHAARWDAVAEGLELLQEGRLEDAVAELTRVVEDDPDNEYGFHFLGNVHYEQEDWARALKCYVRALELAPRYLGAMMSAGHALRMMGRLDQALRMGKQALMAANEDPDALYLMGVIHFQRGDNEAAIEYLQRFLDTRPEVEVAFEVEGMLQVLRGEVAEHPAAEDGEE